MTRVVMGLLFDERGNILIAKRDRTKRFGGLWEFPGGKIEQNESIEAALAREILEELDAPVTIDQVLPGYICEHRDMRAEFIPVTGSITPSDITLLEHEEHRFIKLSELTDFSFPPFDYQAIEFLQRELM